MSEGLIGVLIGAAAAVIGGLLGELLSYHFYKKKDIRQDLKSTYEIAIQCITKAVSDIPMTQEDFAKVRETYIKMGLYADKTAYKFFREISKIILKQEKTEDDMRLLGKKTAQLETYIRKTLGIKDWDMV